MLISLTVGKVDAGVAVLLTQDKRLIEFPSILLPPNISSGSIVDIAVARNLASETASQSAFQSLQNSIFTTFGQRSPSPPVLRCRNATQTSVVLEWDPIQLATAELRSLSLYRNGSKAGSIPRPTEVQSTKISGLAVDTEYVFHLVLRTSAGTYASEKLAVKTHKMTDLSGITITPGVLPAPLRDSLETAVERIGAKLIDTVRIDTTHFVCIEGRGQMWEKAVEMNIPVVRPEWVEGCEREGRIVGVRGYYLNADPRLRQVGPGVGVQNQEGGRQSTQNRNSRGQPQPPPQPQPHPSPGPTESQGEESSHGSPTPARSNGATDDTPASPPPPPPPKNDHPVEPKLAGGDDEHKLRREDGDRLRKPIERAPSSESTEEEEEGGGHTPGDGGSFSEVAL
ncbi:MAG: Chitin synthase, class 5 [Geoglossum umbratile]|nr:MAG: Chitin synthase, class 5 [Geoglossum umbratile]